MKRNLDTETNKNKYMTQTIKSYSFSQEEIIENILTLHSKNNVIDVDTTYSTGVFYKSGRIQQPRYKFDIKPQAPGVIKGRASSLSLDNNSIQTLMFDPPFLVNKHWKKSTIKMIKRFGCYKSMNSLKKDYRNSLIEFQRVLEVGGIVIVKCQDVMFSNTNHMISDWVVATASRLGLKPIDKFIYIKKNRFGIRCLIQRHARKHHSYFLVFQKTRTPKNKRVSGIQRVLRIKPTTNYKSEIFKEAWLIAKLEALRNGGSCRDHISQGLKMAWRNYKACDLVEFKIAA
jgi:hypothetical protein